MRRADRVHGNAEGDGLHLEHVALHVVAEIGLRQQDDRLRAALPGEREEPLDPPEVVVRVEAADDEDDVDVRRDDLRLRLRPGDLADERASPGQDRADRRPALVRARGDGQPVADGRMLVVVAQPAGELGTQLAVRGVDDVLGSVLDGRARGHEAVLFIRVERLGERRVPAQGLEIQRVFLLKAWVPKKWGR